MMTDERTMIANAYLLADAFGHKWAEVISPFVLSKIMQTANNVPQAIAMIYGNVNLVDPVDPDWPLSRVGIRKPAYNGVVHHSSGSGTVSWAISPRKTIITVRNHLCVDPESGFTRKVDKDYGGLVMRMEIGTKRPTTVTERIAFGGQNYVHDKNLNAWIVDGVAQVKTVKGDQRNEFVARKIISLTNINLGV